MAVAGIRANAATRPVRSQKEIKALHREQMKGPKVKVEHPSAGTGVFSRRLRRVEPELVPTDGSKFVLKKVAADYDAHDRLGAMSFLQRHAALGQVVTGLLYVDREPEDLHRHFNTVAAPLNSLSDQELCPGSAALDKINAGLR
jgi:hypothetical protein